MITPTQAEAVRRKRQFSAEIARKALELQRNSVAEEKRRRDEQNARAMASRAKKLISLHGAADWWHCMWFYDLLRDLPSDNASEFPSCMDIQYAVCRRYRVTRVDLISDRRTADIMRPRQIAYFLCRKLTRNSMPKIGRFFGGKDHTAILSGVRKIDRLRQADQKLEATLHAIAAELGASLG